MSKNIQMPEAFVVDVYKLILRLNAHESDLKDTDILEHARRLQKQIEAKMERMERRTAFTEYKTATSPEEREKKRQEYLAKASMHQDW